MATATRSPLVEQAEKIDGLARYLSEGRLLEKPVRLADSDTVWRGPIRDGFMGWIGQALDFWVRNQLAEGLRLVARSLFDRAAAVEQAAQQMLATGQVTVAPPALPAPLNYTPGTPPQYGNIGGGENNTFNVPEMRNLSNLLLATADEVMNFARTLDQALQPPPAPPPPPGTPPPINPLPPDAEAVVGYPQVYLEIANQLRSAAMDVAKRADLVMAAEGPMDTVTYDLGLADSAASGAAAQATSSDSAAGQAADAAQQPEEKPPPTEEEIRIAREEGEKLAAKALDEKALEDPKKLKEIAKELEAHKNDPAAEAYAAAFVKKFGPKNMLAIPRAVHSFQTGEPREESKNPWVRATKPPPAATTEDKEDILFAFSATLATASQSEEFDQKVEDEIFATDDKLALAWLLANPNADFNADFLVRAFEEGVIEQIKDELALTGIGAYGGKSPGDLELTSTKLSTDTKIVVLDAISRNKEAAMRIANMKFDPPLEVGMGLLGPRDVDNVVELLYLGGESNNGYQDDGAALGRMLDSAHKGFVENGDAGNAKELVDRILGGATNDKEVKSAQPYLRLIGLRQPVTEDDVNKALADVREDPKHPGCEALLAMASKSKEAAVEFAQTAAEAASKSKVDPDKVFELKSLYETDAGWDHIARVQAQDDPKTRNLAETVTEQSVIAVAGDEKLTDAARRGMAKAITANVAGFATSVTLYKEAPGDPRPSDKDPSAVGIHVAAVELRDAMAELMKDPEARRTLEMGAGNLTASWGSRTATQELDKLLGRPHPEEEVLNVDRDADYLGEYLCTMVAAVGKSAEDKAQAAVDALAGMRLGTDLLFMGVDFAKGFVPGGNVLFTKSAKWLFDQGMEKLEGGLDVEGMSEGLKGGAKYYLSDNVRSKEEAEWAKAKADVEGTHVLVDNLVRDTLACNLLSQALARPPGERDQLLDALHIRATADDGTELRGLAALQDAGLLNNKGEFGIPPAGTAEYTRYLDWTGHEAKAFAEKVDDMGKETAQHFTDCMVTHLDIKGTKSK